MIEELAAVAQAKRENMIEAKHTGDIIAALNAATEYADAIEAWHKARFPGKKFRKPAAAYLLRAI